MLRTRLEYHVFNHADNPAAFEYLKLLPSNILDKIGMRSGWSSYDVREELKRLGVPNDSFILSEGTSFSHIQ